MKSKNFALTAAFLCLGFACNISAQTNLTGSIRGRIIRGESRGVRMAEINVLNLITLESETRHANDFGYFQFNNLPYGDLYYITYKTKKSGNFITYASFQLKVSVNQITIVAN